MVDATNKALQRKIGFKAKRTSIPWNATRFRRSMLADFFAEQEYTEGVEVGTRRGKYAVVLCKANPSLHLTCVDPWAPYAGRKYTKEIQDGIYAEAVSNLAQYNATLMRLPSLEAVKQFQDRSLDFVFIDGDHTFDHAVRDIIEWSAKVKVGGVVAVHDYYHFTTGGVVHAVDGYTRAHGITPWYVTKEREPTAFWVNR